MILTNEAVARAIEARREPLSNLVPGSNPRRKKPELKYVGELAESMRKHDVIEPLIVRPHQDGTLQIVCGETRFLAAKMAGLVDVPIIVRDYDDLDVIEVQLIENIQRASMHPIDEGEAFRKLITAKKHTAETLASTLGKSIRWVFQRIAFAEDLTTEVKDAFGKDEITSKHAEILIRLDKKEQPKALREGCFVTDWLNHEKVKRLASTRELEEYIGESIEKPASVEKLQQQLPDVAEAAAVAEAKGAKLLQLVDTYGDFNKLDAGVLRQDQWKAAGGQQKCQYAEKGVVVMGADIGAVFQVCITRECAKHWPKPVTHKQTPQQQSETARVKKRHDTWAQDQARAKARAAKWTATVKKAGPALQLHVKHLKALPSAAVRLALVEALPYGTSLGRVQKAMGSDPVKNAEKALVTAAALDCSNTYKESAFRALAAAVGLKLTSFEQPEPKKKAAKPGLTKAQARAIHKLHPKLKRKAGKKR